METIEIYTDGACSNNPGPGGWAAIVLYQGECKEIVGSEKRTTNNKMELTAVIEALESLQDPSKVRLYSDSAYIVNCMNQRWYQKWLKNGWHTAKGQPVENRDLWEKLLRLIKFHQVEFIKVKGHSDNVLNNRCDELARKAVPH